MEHTFIAREIAKPVAKLYFGMPMSSKIFFINEVVAINKIRNITFFFIPKNNINYDSLIDGLQLAINLFI